MFESRDRQAREGHRRHPGHDRAARRDVRHRRRLSQDRGRRGQEARHPGDRRRRHQPLARGIDYVIPGNDDSAKAVALYARAVADAVLEGKAQAVTEVVQAGRRQRRVRRSQRRRLSASAEPSVEAPRPRARSSGGSSMNDDAGLRPVECTAGPQRPHFGVSYARNHCKHGGRTARQDRRADDGVQEGADRSRRRRRRAPRRSCASSSATRPARPRRASPPKASSPRRSTAAPARWSRSTARPTSSRRTTRSWPSPRPARRWSPSRTRPTSPRCRRCRCRRTASARRWKTCARA